jgi:hypothetical protein
MMKVKLTQTEIDGLVSVDRVVVKPTVSGVGFNDVGFQMKINGKNIWQYHLWMNMLQRAFDAKYKQRSPTYEDATCCDEWLSFANFLEWVNKEVEYKGHPVGFALDKDIIVKGNKTYSPDVCSLVPQAVNSLLLDSGAARGDFPIGVTFDKRRSKFIAQLGCFGKMKHLGRYDTIEDAVFTYKTAKEAQIKIVATQYKDVLKPAVYESLMNWEITP